ncbi:uncharacterized protein TRAVEDRAFT_51961 [Trametes versicolor FP-101664 SS1]|uniref:uncharacterized protein n=1 Tax=Trametes versicolor (strain FP-101664) TaxID=717944 RepID=UPI0004623181|nr:uncharacterized protein TRAVEDRAFT_51961 [Trametes versicolor FP-101664 SS1]EIW54244.1 hypothetical protein TRAVEDRAFT_51961 [Trametes versicolor FP-101664 SS1]
MGKDLGHPWVDPWPALSFPSISQVLDSHKLGQRYEYFMRWSGRSPDKDSWVPLSDLSLSPAVNELVDRFHHCHPRAPHPHQLVFERTVPVPADSIDTPSSTLQASAPPSAPSAPLALPVLPVSSVAVPPPASSMPAPVPPLPASSVPAPARRPAAVPLATPRPSSPPPAPRVNLRQAYVPPPQTTTRSGHVSKPACRPDE